MLPISNLPDPLSAVSNDASSVKDAIFKVMDLFFGGSAKDKLEGAQKDAGSLASQVKIPEGVPRPFLPPEVAARVSGVGALGVKLMPILQLLTGALQAMDKDSVKSLTNALSSMGGQLGGATQMQAQAVKGGMAASLASFGQELGRPVASVDDLTQTELEKFMLKPAPAIPGVNASQDSEEALESSPTWGGTLDKLSKILPVTPVAVDAPELRNPTLYDENNNPITAAFNQEPMVPKPSGTPKSVFSQTAPTVAFKVNPTRSTVHPLATMGDPSAALRAALDLAKDMHNLAAQQREVAGNIQDITDAAKDLAGGNDRASFRKSLLTILRSMVLINLTADAGLNLESLTKAAMKDWEGRQTQVLAPDALAQAFNPESYKVRDLFTKVSGQAQYILSKPATFIELVEYAEEEYKPETGLFSLDREDNKVVIYEDLIQDDERFYVNYQSDDAAAAALQQLSNATTELESADQGLGAFPGNLIYAAIGDDVYIGTLNSLLPTLGNRVAQRTGVVPGKASLIYNISNLLEMKDNRLSEVPDILMGKDPTLLANQGVLYNFVDLLVWLTQNPNLARDLFPFETLVSSLSILFINLVNSKKEMGYGTFKDKLELDQFNSLEIVDLTALCRAWDTANQSAPATAPVGSPAVVVDFLDRLHSVQPEPGLSLEQTLVTYLASLAQVDPKLGTDLVFATAAACSLNKALVVLDEEPDDDKAIERLKEIFTVGGKFYDKVQNFPNKGCLGRLKEAL